MNDLYIEIDKDKEPYYKKISDDKVINLTGESGSGKSYYSTKYINDDNYIVIDTDEVYGRFDKSKGANRKFGEYLRSKYDVLPDNCGQFDLLLSEILEYFKDTDKILVIDSAQYRNIKDYNTDSSSTMKLQKLALASTSKLTELTSEGEFDTESILTSASLILII